MRLPHPLQRVRDLGFSVFTRPHSANLVVCRDPHGKPGQWDGVIYLARTEADGGGWRIDAWPCATRPGPAFIERPMNAAGVGMLAAGIQNRGSHKRGAHRGRPALIQAGTVVVLRDPKVDHVFDPVEPESNLGGGFNIHDVTSPRQLAGCIGLYPAHMAELLLRFEELERYQGKLVSLTVL